MWRLLSALALAVMLAPVSVYAQRDRDTYNPNNQTFEISGQVNLAGGNSPLADVPVRLERFSGGIVDQMSTDSRGRFRFTNVGRGYYKAIINMPGFGPAQQDADLTLLFRAYLVFTLTKIDTTPANALLTTDVIDARIPASAREEYSRGRKALAKNSQRDAVTHLQKALALYSQFFEAQLLLSTAFMDLREWAQAETSLTQALALKPDNAAATLALGEVYWRQKRTADAEKTLLEGLKLDDKNWHGHFTLGRLYWENGDVMKAAPEIGRTIQLKPDFAEAHLMAGNILLRLKQSERALSEYQEYLRLAPKGEYSTEARQLVTQLQKLVSKP